MTAQGTRSEQAKCHACGDWVDFVSLHIWQPPALIAFACTKAEYWVCEPCLSELPREEAK